MLASVARYCEKKRSITIPEVSRNVATRFHSPGPPAYRFNPVTLFSKLTGEESVPWKSSFCRLLTFAQRQSRIASWLGLPYVPDMVDCSWQDLGLVSVQKYVDIVATERTYDLDEVYAPPCPYRLPFPPPFDDDVFRAAPITSIAQILAPASHSLDPSLSQIQSVRTMQNDVLPYQVQFPSQMILHPGSDLPCPAPPQPNAQYIQEEPRCGEPSPKRQRFALWHPQTQTDLEHPTHVNCGPKKPLSAGDKSIIDAKRRHTSLGQQNTNNSLTGYTTGYTSYGHSGHEMGRPFDAFSQFEEIHDP